MIGIYKITNPIGEFYIGQSRDIKERLKGHKYKKCTSKNLKRSFELFTFKNHTVEIVEICEIDQLLIRERFYIKTLKPTLNGIQGSPKKEEVKKLIGFRLASDVREVIKSKPNQSLYIEQLVLDDFNSNK